MGLPHSAWQREVSDGSATQGAQCCLDVVKADDFTGTVHCNQTESKEDSDAAVQVQAENNLGALDSEAFSCIGVEWAECCDVTHGYRPENLPSEIVLRNQMCCAVRVCVWGREVNVGGQTQVYVLRNHHGRVRAEHFTMARW